MHPLNLDQALQSIGLQGYTQIFRNEGFETWQQLLDITEDDMMTLGIKLGHRRRLQVPLQDSKQQDWPDNLDARSSHESPENPQAYRSPRHREADSSVRKENSSVSCLARRQKRKYHRHPKPDHNAPERPPSAYVIFSNCIRERLRGQDISFIEIAKLVGKHWQDPNPEERAACERQAQSMKEIYYSQLTEYKKTPDYHSYQTDLADFKAKHGDNNAREAQQRNTSHDGNLSTTRSDSNQGIAVGISPETDDASTVGHTAPSLSNFSHGFTDPQTDARMGKAVKRSDQPSSSLFTRPSPAYNAPRAFPNARQERRWDSIPGPYQEQSSECPIATDGDVGEQEFRFSFRTLPCTIEQSTFAQMTDKTSRTDSLYINRDSSLSSPTPLIDPRPRSLLPPGPSRQHAQHDILQLSQRRQHTARLAPLRAALLDQSSSLSLPPIRNLEQYS